MSDKTRKKIVYSALVLAIIWGAYSFSESGTKQAAVDSPETIEPIARTATGGTAVVTGEEVARLEAADWGDDPFGVVSTGTRAPGPSWSLRGIVYSPTSPMAYVNGQRVRIGDTVNRATVTAIGKTSVTLRFDGREFDIHVRKG